MNRSLTSTLGPSDKGRPRGSRAPFTRSGQQNLYLIFHIWVQMPEFVSWRIYDVRLGPVSCGGAVLHFFKDDGPVTNDGVGVWLDP